MENRVGKWRYALIISIALIILAIYCARLVQWQFFQNDFYEDIALTSTEYTIKTDAIRGEIYDKNGVPLAINKSGYRIVINKLYMPDSELNENIVRLVKLLEGCKGKWIDELPIKIDNKGNYYFDEKKTEEIEDLKSKDNLNMNPYSTAAECMTKLVEKYDCEKFGKSEQRNIVSVRYNMDRLGYSKSTPYVFADDISQQVMSIISENMQSVQGVETESTAVRVYENGTAAPHMVGITGLISEKAE